MPREITTFFLRKTPANALAACNEKGVQPLHLAVKNNDKASVKVPP